MLTALVLRIPSIFRRDQRASLLILIPLATGALSIQLLKGWPGHAFVAHLGVSGLDQLVVQLVAAADFAALWIFVRLLNRGNEWRSWALPLTLAVSEATATVLVFATSAPGLTFTEIAIDSAWRWYALSWVIFVLTASVGTLWEFSVIYRNESTPAVCAGIALLMTGTALELVYAPVRLIRWFGTTSELLVNICFWSSFFRFILVALGCTIVTLSHRLIWLIAWRDYRALESICLDLGTLRIPAGPQVLPSLNPTDKILMKRLNKRIIAILDRMYAIHKNSDGQYSNDVQAAATMILEKCTESVSAKELHARCRPLLDTMQRDGSGWTRRT